MTRVTFVDGQSFQEDLDDFGDHSRSTQYVNHRTADHDTPGETITGGRTEGGSLRSTSELGDKDIIRVAGGETSVAAALAARLVSRQADGSLVVNDPAAAPSQDSATSDSEGEDQLEAMDRSTEELITQAAESGEELAVSGIIADVSKGVDASDNDLGRIASRLQIEPEEARERYEAVRAGFTKQAEDRVSKDTGLSAQAIFDWAWEAKPDLMSEAITNHMHNRSTNGYTKVAKAYMENLDTIDPEGLMEALRRNGFTKVEKTSKGKILFDDGSGQMDWRSAIKGGVIKPAGL